MTSRFRARKLFIFIFLFLSLILFLTHFIFASTVVEPARFLLTAKPGGRVTDTIKVTNPSDKEVNLSAAVYDWALNNADRMVTSEVGTRKDTLKGLIKFNPQNFKLAPGESQIVRLTVTAPREGELFERRGIVFFEEKIPYIDKDGIGSNVITQVGATIYLSIEGTRMAFKIEKAVVERSVEGNYQLNLGIANLGAGHIRYAINCKFINEKNVLVNEANIQEKVLLPDLRRNVFQKLPEKLSPGKYNLVLTINFLGTEKLLKRNIPFKIGN